MDEQQENEIGAEEAAIRAELTEEIFGEGKSEHVEIEDIPKAEADPWEGVSPAVREKLETLSGKASVIDTLETRLKQAENRVGSLQNTIQNNRTATAKLTPEQQAKIDAFKEEFGDIHDVMKLMTAGIAGNQTAATVDPSIIQELRKEIAATKTATSTEIETLQLRLQHPDYQDTIKSKDWQKWLIDQEPEVKNKINSPKSADAIDILNRFHRDHGNLESAASIAAKRKAKLDTNVQAATGRKATVPKAEADMTEAEIRAQEIQRIWGSKGK